MRGRLFAVLSAAELLLLIGQWYLPSLVSFSERVIGSGNEVWGEVAATETGETMCPWLMFVFGSSPSFLVDNVLEIPLCKCLFTKFRFATGREQTKMF